MNNVKSLLSAMLFFAVATMFLVSCEDDSLLPPTNYCGDGIMNFGELGIDCGGNCAPCAFTVNCFDGIQNGDETGVDCGGSCAPCVVTVATCTDGIMNGDETGVDCGGSCPPCATTTCTDGIMNGDETGVDCGGSCPPCGTTTCTDGIMNGDETGVDCGGSCPPCTLPTGEYLTADVDGVAFAAQIVLGELVESGTVIGFQSDQSQERQMFFRVPSDITMGTYDLTTSGYSVEYQAVSVGAYVTQSGTLTITSHDTVNQELTGTFEFTSNYTDVNGVVTSTVVVTNGAFNAEYL